MEINFTFNKKKEQIKAGDEALQVIALIYLKEALVKERYEECAELVRAAKRFGATQGEIKQMLVEGARGLNVVRKVEVPRERSGRKRF